MAYKNFIPNVWSATIERELEQACVFVEDCNRQYEGEAKKCGDQVRILGVGKPTISTLARESASGDINGPEEVPDTSVTLIIDQIRYFNYMVGDIDEAQSKPNGIMDALAKETTEALAQEVDAHIANLVVDPVVSKVYSSAPTVVAGTASSGQKNVLDALDDAQQKLFENNVPISTDVVVTISPRFYKLFRQAYRTADTHNSEILKNGKVATYSNMTIKMSNAVKKTQTSSAGDTDNIMVRTKRAVAYANPLTHTEAYRPEKKFADAVKGFILFGARIVRAKEIFNLNVKFA